MTPQEYVANGGYNCPNCGSENLVGGSFDADYDMAWRTVTCDACDHQWRELFKLSGMEELT